MKPEEIKITDWLRILVGEVPGEFYIEIIIRAAFIYLMLMVAMRLLGKRMSSQLGRTELVALVTLAAAVGVPIQAPDRGLLPVAVIALVIIYTGRWISLKAFKDQGFEHIVEGNISPLVNDSVLNLELMKDVRLPREHLVAHLRYSGIKQLGQVKRLYMEANGSFTLIENEEPTPGLSVIPHWDKELNDRLEKSRDLLVCEVCGTTRKQPFDRKEQCANCSRRSWTEAVL